MMRLLVLFILIPFIGLSQKIKKDKQAAISEVKLTGKVVDFIEGRPNIFFYQRYDELGEASVFYFIENNQVRKVLFISETPTQPFKRAKEAFKTVDKGYQVDPDLKGVFIGTNSCYYSGKARYEAIANHQEKRYYLEIIILD